MRSIVIAKALVLTLWSLYLAVGLSHSGSHGREQVRTANAHRCL